MTADNATLNAAALRVALASCERVRATYVENLAKIAGQAPWESDKIASMAMGVRIIDAVSAQMQGGLSGAMLDEHLQQRTARMARAMRPSIAERVKRVFGHL